MTDITIVRQALLHRIREGKGDASHAERRAAFENDELPEPLRTLIDKVVKRASDITDEDVAAVRDAGISEDRIFELVVCAAVGQASRQYENALAALDDATRWEES